MGLQRSTYIFKKRVVEKQLAEDIVSTLRIPAGYSTFVRPPSHQPLQTSTGDLLEHYQQQIEI